MTVKQTIVDLNTKFQKSYYDEDLGFFESLIPQMVEEIESFIDSFSERHTQLKYSLEKVKNILKEITNDRNRLLDLPAPTPPTKDCYLNTMKRNASSALWEMHDIIFHSNPRLLQDVL
jgi:hypothetical protein